jgi:hypothetical protein
MKLTGLARMSVLISLLGSAALFYAQDQRDDKREEKPQQQEEARPEAKHSGEEAKPSKKQEGKPPRDEARPEERENNKSSQHMERGEQPQHEQRAGGQRGGHIPDDQFRSHFGRQHTVVINRPTVVEGQPRFQYGGYWFTIADPWPGDWAYTDQCYIDYIDGEYFLFDLLHPGVRIALFVVM